MLIEFTYSLVLTSLYATLPDDPNPGWPYACGVRSAAFFLHVSLIRKLISPPSVSLTHRAWIVDAQAGSCCARPLLRLFSLEQRCGGRLLHFFLVFVLRSRSSTSPK